ncbi:hypothetical protein DWX58_14170 [Pseudoflavonifractor sp. AF19-9AC]|uniref:hypothetical protein n=1 Tax=Pseudoflavonifractor sp. AF19-9AC TaxID=2292244 RepID=UPI000E513207|nr:hypothetical protein [Pseudoflavonifractor sp. AF19-9AC]RHR05675.1 hypothetical protein DWX58_14170 [Pseudoflavonifractor sp. AF19-9AC]
MSFTSTGLGQQVLTFLISGGGVFLMAVLLVSALAGLFRSRSATLRLACGMVLLLCLLYAGLLLWLTIGFGGSSGPPTPIQP